VEDRYGARALSGLPTGLLREGMRRKDEDGKPAHFNDITCMVRAIRSSAKREGIVISRHTIGIEWNTVV
jgi:hypothetical protein